MAGTLYYRIEDRSGHAYLHTFDVLSTTALGVWLSVYGRKRFQLLECRKRFACPTVEAAEESFRARKRRQLGILRVQIEHVERALEDAETRPWVNSGGAAMRA